MTLQEKIQKKAEGYEAFIDKDKNCWTWDYQVLEIVVIKFIIG